jgi:hypothetical protein
LKALRVIAEAGLLPTTAARRAVAVHDIAGVSYWSQDPDDERRMLEVERSLLRVTCGLARPDDPPRLAAASRDHVTRIRIASLHGAIETKMSQPVVQSAFFSALYDPDADVQVQGIEALRRGLIGDRAVRDLAESRARALWPAAPRRVRTRLAAMAKTLGLDDLIEAARRDKSWVVRHEVS